MKKTMRIGTMKVGRWNADIFVEAEYDKEGKLSISGVVGPKANGNAIGASGQIDMSFAHRNPKDNDRREHNPTKPGEIKFAPGWDKEKWFDFLDIWKRWHLNDMKANCEHQTGPEWDAGKELTLYYFRTKEHVNKAIKAYKDRTMAALMTGEAVTPTKEEMRLSALQSNITYHLPELPDAIKGDYEPNKPHYAGDTYSKPSEVKTAGWTTPKEHPEGMLMRACPVCGYEYGSAWRKEAVPQSVIDFIRSLPDADKKPAWV